MKYKLKTDDIEAIPAMYVILAYPCQPDNAPQWLITNFDRKVLKFDSGGTLFLNGKEMLAQDFIVKNSKDDGVYLCHSEFFLHLYERVE